MCKQGTLVKFDPGQPRRVAKPSTRMSVIAPVSHGELDRTLPVVNAVERNGCLDIAFKLREGVLVRL